MEKTSTTAGTRPHRRRKLGHGAGAESRPRGRRGHDRRPLRTTVGGGTGEPRWLRPNDRDRHHPRGTGRPPVRRERAARSHRFDRGGHRRRLPAGTARIGGVRYQRRPGLSGCCARGRAQAQPRQPRFSGLFRFSFLGACRRREEGCHAGRHGQTPAGSPPSRARRTSPTRSASSCATASPQGWCFMSKAAAASSDTVPTPLRLAQEQARRWRLHAPVTPDHHDRRGLRAWLQRQHGGASATRGHSDAGNDGAPQARCDHLL